MFYMQSLTAFGLMSLISPVTFRYREFSLHFSKPFVKLSPFLQLIGSSSFFLMFDMRVGYNLAETPGGYSGINVTGGGGGGGSDGA